MKKYFVGVFFLLSSILFAESKTDTLRIDGSLSVIAVMPSIIEAFNAIDQSLFVNTGRGLEGGSARIAALRDHRIDIALAAKKMAIHEPGFRYIQIGSSAVICAVNGAVPVVNITKVQLQEIFSGGINSWNRIDTTLLLPLQLFVRPKSNADMEIVYDFIGVTKDSRAGSWGIIVARPENMVDSICTRIGSIGITSRLLLVNAPKKTHPVAIDGIYPSNENITAGMYPLIRPVTIIVRDESNNFVDRFIKFLESPEGKRALVKNGM